MRAQFALTANEAAVAVQTHGTEVHPEGHPASCQACLESRRMLEGASRCRPPTGSTPPRHLEGRRRGALQMGAVGRWMLSAVSVAGEVAMLGDVGGL